MSKIFEWLSLGGPAMFVLLGLSVAALTLTIVKLWEFFEIRIWQRQFVAGALDAWHRGQPEQALAVLAHTPNPLAEVMSFAIAHRRGGASDAELRELVTQYAADRLEGTRSLLRPLEVISNLAPLLGLLGTVLGMIEVFRRLQEAGDKVNPSILSGGLWEALLTTAAGLAVAILSLSAFHFFDRQVERLHQAMESALTRIFNRPLVAAARGEQPATAESAGSANAY